MKKIEDEGLGIGFLDFLDDIEVKADQEEGDYKPPPDDYKFNKHEYEVALGESDMEDFAKDFGKGLSRDEEDEDEDDEEGEGEEEDSNSD